MSWAPNLARREGLASIARSAATILALALVGLTARSVAASEGTSAGTKAGTTSKAGPSGATGIEGWGGSPMDQPYHRLGPQVACGGHASIRFGHDRVSGIADPEWLSFPRIAAFAVARLGDRVELRGDAAYDRAPDELSIERAEVGLWLGDLWRAQAGILLLPLGRTNLDHDSPADQLTQRSYVATELVGVPTAQAGFGVRHGGRPTGGWTYELDVVTGYDDGVVTEASQGTRIPAGRNVAGDNNGIPAMAGRVAWRSGSGAELGLAAIAGPYNQREVDGVALDDSRQLVLAVADVDARVLGCRIFGEVGLAYVDIPPGLEGLYAERQGAASLEVSRTLREPLWRAWRGSSLTGALRADAVDLDQDHVGDSRSRLSAGLNLRPSSRGVLRLGWFYERRHDRFGNETPAASAEVAAALYF